MTQSFADAVWEEKEIWPSQSVSGATLTRGLSHMMLGVLFFSLMLSRQHSWSKRDGVSEGRGVGRFGLCSEVPLNAWASTWRLDNMKTEFCWSPSWPYLHCSPLGTPAFSDILTLQEESRDLHGGGGSPAMIAVPNPLLPLEMFPPQTTKDVYW